MKHRQVDSPCPMASAQWQKDRFAAPDRPCGKSWWRNDSAILVAIRHHRKNICTYCIHIRDTNWKQGRILKTTENMRDESSKGKLLNIVLLQNRLVRRVIALRKNASASAWMSRCLKHEVWTKLGAGKFCIYTFLSWCHVSIHSR